ncbi:MAG: hypothetical protein FD123_657 [Bacteroidetes bacterium]|nr:MAG: hypothetical protein FD123_657 [Bacteroidota bacterium]
MQNSILSPVKKSGKTLTRMISKKRKFQVAIIDGDPRFSKALGGQLGLAFGMHACITVFNSTQDFPSKHCRRPDLVLLDPSAGKNTGADPMNELWRIKDSGKCSVIIMSAQLDGNTIREARRFGAADYAEKNLSELGRIIEKTMPYAHRVLNPRRSGYRWTPSFSTSPGALLAILMTVFLGAWMFFNFN